MLISKKKMIFENKWYFCIFNSQFINNVMQKFTKAIAAIILSTTILFAVGCRLMKKDKTIEVVKVSHESVDLGLPSGTLWATCNIGAENPEDYGNHFAWGETIPNTTCDWEWGTYKYCNGVRVQLTKYCDKSDYGYNGFTDTLTTLQPMDDAATANWGSDWCMPTKAQWRELIDNTTNMWTTHNGVNGLLLTASNGNYLFLPAAGSLWDDEINYGGSRGYYWSGSLLAGSPDYAWGFDFKADQSIIDETTRNAGFSVRAVRSSR